MDRVSVGYRSEVTMKIVIYAEDGVTVVYGATAVDVETNKGLIADSIPDDEWSQGFRFTENDNEDSNTVAAKN